MKCCICFSPFGLSDCIISSYPSQVKEGKYLPTKSSCFAVWTARGFSLPSGVDCDGDRPDGKQQQRAPNAACGKKPFLSWHACEKSFGCHCCHYDCRRRRRRYHHSSKIWHRCNGLFSPTEIDNSGQAIELIRDPDAFHRSRHLEERIWGKLLSIKGFQIINVPGNVGM